MNEAIPVVAIDGPSGAGKGVITQRLASFKGYHVLDSGAIYRVIGLAAREDGLDFRDRSGLVKLAKALDICFRSTGESENPLSVWLRGKDVTKEVRTNEAGLDASKVACIGELRTAIRGLQRSFKRSPGLVADGRDMGTVIFSDAKHKIFLTASAEERAKRRQTQLKRQGLEVNMRSLLQELEERDRKDTEREHSPLIPAEDSVIIDTSNLNPEGVVKKIKTYL